MNTMVYYIKTWANIKGCTYMENTNIDNCLNVYNLLTNNIFTENDDGIVNYYYGCYYKELNDIPNMIKHLLISIDSNNHEAMFYLGSYYEYKNDYNMMKYCLMAINLNNYKAMNLLGGYFRRKNDIDNMIKYHIMASKFNCGNSILYLAEHYDKIEDYDNMIKYYLMAIKLNGSTGYYAIRSLIYYYKSIKDYDNMIKYMLIGNTCDEIIKLDFICPKMLLILYNKYLHNVLDICKEQFIKQIIKFLTYNIINSDLLLLITNINLNHFDNPNKLLIVTKQLLDKKITSMNMCYNCIT